MSKRAKNDAQQISEQEERESLPVGRGSEGAGCPGVLSEGEPIGTPRDDRTWAGASILTAISGGILAQLIQDAEDQLQQVEACIQWYEDEKEKVLARLLNLRRLDSLQTEDGSEQ